MKYNRMTFIPLVLSCIFPTLSSDILTTIELADKIIQGQATLDERQNYARRRCSLFILSSYQKKDPLTIQSFRFIKIHQPTYKDSLFDIKNDDYNTYLYKFYSQYYDLTDCERPDSPHFKHCQSVSNQWYLAQYYAPYAEYLEDFIRKQKK